MIKWLWISVRDKLWKIARLCFAQCSSALIYNRRATEGFKGGSVAVHARRAVRLICRWLTAGRGFSWYDLWHLLREIRLGFVYLLLSPCCKHLICKTMASCGNSVNSNYRNHSPCLKSHPHTHTPLWCSHYHTNYRWSLQLPCLNALAVTLSA